MDSQPLRLPSPPGRAGRRRGGTEWPRIAKTVAVRESSKPHGSLSLRGDISYVDLNVVARAHKTRGGITWA
ncbi:hypothetical protein SMC26_16070 [Actinomadura fulvescens]|uniref:Transposase n=1 Tax=Actinomadura fulvescens TaxID=46160 RepID=A0ABN3QVT0_9ACTN